jgi:hypothetical protein
VSERQDEEQVVSRAAGVRVLEGDLGARSLIGSGGATDVHRLDSFTVPGHHGGLAFVRVRDRLEAHWDSGVLSRLVALRWHLDPRERATLDAVAAWPVAVVEGDDGAVVGCLVPLAAHPFYYVPSDDKGKHKVPQHAKWLVVAPKRARRAGAAAVGERDLVARSTVLARVCLLIDLLHRNGMVYGDLSDRSVLFGVGDVAEAFVVGCEGVAFVGEGVAQRNGAGWAAPETLDGGTGVADAADKKTDSSASTDASETAESAVPSDGSESKSSSVQMDAAIKLNAAEKANASMSSAGAVKTDAAMSTAASVQTVETDRYKLGLLILRVLAPAGDGLERSRDAGRIRSVLDETGQRMMHDALGEDPAGRPSASEWYGYLRSVIVQNLSAPEIRRVVVSPALVAEGDEVRLDVELSGTRQLTIELPGRADITREVGGRTVSERFTARQSGRIGVRAVNDHGETAALSNVVRVLPVPTPSRLPLDAAEVPAGLGVLPDLASLEAALGISMPPVSRGSGAGTGPAASPFDRVAELRERLETDALPLHDVLRIGLEAERASREQLFPPFEEFLNDIGAPDDRR